MLPASENITDVREFRTLDDPIGKGYFWFSSTVLLLACLFIGATLIAHFDGDWSGLAVVIAVPLIFGTLLRPVVVRLYAAPKNEKLVCDNDGVHYIDPSGNHVAFAPYGDIHYVFANLAHTSRYNINLVNPRWYIGMRGDDIPIFEMVENLGDFFKILVERCPQVDWTDARPFPGDPKP